MMSDPRPEEIIQAEKLLDNGKIDDALEIIINFEKKNGINQNEQLWALLIRGWVNIYKLQFKEGVEVAE